MREFQLGLYDHPRYVVRSQTSQEAAHSIREGAPTLRSRVLSLLRARPAGATDEEVQVALGMNPSTERPRRIELCEAGLVVDSGKRRPTASGRMATVWFAPFSGEVAPGPDACDCTEDAACAECSRR